MITIRKNKERGFTKTDWLESYHSFSFADYFDPQHTEFRSLRVINEDIVQPAKGFATHGHANMEIMTYVLEGALEHQDSLGNGSVIRPGEVQLMSAGTGVRHSEFNPSSEKPVHLLQIWIKPDTQGLQPYYQQENFTPQARQNRLCLLVSKDGDGHSLVINQDVAIYAATLDAGKEIIFDLQGDRHAWIQVAKGKLKLNGQVLDQGDGAAISEEKSLKFSAIQEAEVLLFDLA